jgi:phage tail tape-measure protein
MNRLVALVVLLSFVALVSGCASMSQPTVYAYPAKGQSAEQASRDRAECEAWAKQQTGFDPAADTAKGAGIGALIGAAAGAATGAAVGAATGSPGKGAAIGAAAGGIGGAVLGGGYKYSKSKEGFNQAYSACMTARGYQVR